MSRNSDGFGYTIVTAPRGEDGKMATFHRYTCTKCAAVLDLPHAGLSNNSERSAHRAAQRGWKTDPWHKSVTVCPECQKSKRPTATPLAPALPLIPPPTFAEAPMTQPVPTIRPDITDIPAEKRHSIRQLLSTHFDDEKGCYVGGMSDEAIADQVNVGRAYVAFIREAAFGPLRISPEMSAALAELETLRSEMTSVASLHADLVNRFGALEEKVRKLSGGKAKAA